VWRLGGAEGKREVADFMEIIYEKLFPITRKEFPNSQGGMPARCAKTHDAAGAASWWVKEGDELVRSV
jgi:hypothetical protein